MKNIIKILIVTIIGVATNKIGYSTVPIVTIFNTVGNLKTVKMNTENEIWKYIHGYDGLYQVSTYVNVKSVDRIILNQGFSRNIVGKLLIKSQMNNGYVSVVLSKNGKTKRCNIHRLVAITFIPNIENKPQVNHIDGNKSNNSKNNLEWCLASENGIHAYKNGLSKSPNKGKFGSDNHRSISVLQLDVNNNIISKFGSVREACRITGIRHISECANNKRNTSGGFIWKYA